MIKSSTVSEMIFVDTSAFYALEVTTDVNHKSAKAFLNELKNNKYGLLLTTDYILDETYTLLRIRKNHTVAMAFLDKVFKSKSIRIIWIDELMFRKALQYAKKYNNLKLSYTDCTSFAVMESFKIKTAFSFDSHFSNVGFTRLP